MNNNNDLKLFLSKPINKNNPKLGFTHTSMPGNNMPANSYHISKENLEEFYELYYDRVFVKKIPTHMTEAPDLKGVSPVKVDIDLKYKFNKIQRLYGDGEIKKIIRYHYEEFERWLLPMSEEQKLCFVFEIILS